MLFNSIEFAFFLLLSLVAYDSFPAHKRKYALLAISYVYYFFWSLNHAVLLFAATALCYVAALLIQKSASDLKKKFILFAALIILFAVLASFKYSNLFSGAYALLIPVGISYYTFKAASYLIDVYWEKLSPEKDFVVFANFVSFFPQILSGPIERAVHFLPQMKAVKQIPPDVITSGLRLILFGCFKKLVIADRLALLVDPVYAKPELYNSFTLLVACYGFVFQLYADFSAVTDIARGVARLFGFYSPQNFELPFFAGNIQLYWRRWHMTLTSWLRDYLFLPLQMTLRNWGKAGLILAITINMLAIGAWHGASVTYLVFGALHAVFILVSVFTLKQRDQFFALHPRLSLIRAFTAPLLTFQLVVFASIFFRADSLNQALAVIRNIFLFNSDKLGAYFFSPKDAVIAICGIVLMELIHWIQIRGKLNFLFLNKPIFIRWAVYYGMALLILVFGQFVDKEFIYFKF